MFLEKYLVFCLPVRKMKRRLVFTQAFIDNTDKKSQFTNKSIASEFQRSSVLCPILKILPAHNNSDDTNAAADNNTDAAVIRIQNRLAKINLP